MKQNITDTHTQSKKEKLNKNKRKQEICFVLANHF